MRFILQLHENGAAQNWSYNVESKRVTQTLREHLNNAWSWPDCQERTCSGSMAEAPMMTMPR